MIKLLTSPMEWIKEDKNKNIVITAMSSILFFSGWWIILDLEAYYRGHKIRHMNKGFHLCAFFGTISLAIVNMFPNSALTSDSTHERWFFNKCIFWIFIGFIIGFSAIIGATWIMIDYFAHEVSEDEEPLPDWPPVAVFLQNVLIFSSSLLMRFGRKEVAEF